MKWRTDIDTIKVGDVIQINDMSDNSYVKVQFIRENVVAGIIYYWGHWVCTEREATDTELTTLSFSEYLEDDFCGQVSKSRIKEVGFWICSTRKIDDWKKEMEEY